MKRLTPFLFIATLAAALSGAPSGAAAADWTNAPLRVLFLGDRAGHRPAQRFAILEPVLAQRGIEMTYTESMSDFNPERLAEVDCVLIYANVTRISPEQEKALLDFVSAGGGLVPIH
ncbi:MAG TPA: ThuA domain-containing protein, partial [Verrucomicrobiota bacterium]|nr:ThuA domain-containing protein [Verrucomicrobiota bacterium]